MREIKFRAWHNVNKKFINFYESDLKMFENGQIYAGGMNVTDRITLLQYTGLKDKRGTEIHEGDIVKGHHRTQESFFIKQEVNFFNGCYMFGNWNAHEYFNMHQEIEVIGNIYENPELLQGQNL